MSIICHAPKPIEIENWRWWDSDMINSLLWLCRKHKWQEELPANQSVLTDKHSFNEKQTQIELIFLAYSFKAWLQTHEYNYPKYNTNDMSPNLEFNGEYVSICSDQIASKLTHKTTTTWAKIVDVTLSLDGSDETYSILMHVANH